jgi:hypothetical protein
MALKGKSFGSQKQVVALALDLMPSFMETWWFMVGRGTSYGLQRQMQRELILIMGKESFSNFPMLAKCVSPSRRLIQTSKLFSLFRRWKKVYSFQGS